MNQEFFSIKKIMETGNVIKSKAYLDIKSDSDNSHTEGLKLILTKENSHIVTLSLRNPYREITVSRSDFREALRSLDLT